MTNDFNNPQARHKLNNEGMIVKLQFLFTLSHNPKYHRSSVDASGIRIECWFFSIRPAGSTPLAWYCFLPLFASFFDKLRWDGKVDHVRWRAFARFLLVSIRHPSRFADVDHFT
jgi:hypothetical protein